MAISPAIQAKIDVLTDLGLNFVAPNVKPQAGPTKAPTGAPDGLSARSSKTDSMPPRVSLSAKGGPEPKTTDFPKPAEISSKAIDSAKTDGNDQMKALTDLNNATMNFQMKMAQLDMEKKMNGAAANMIKDVGKVVNQLSQG